MLPFHLLKGSYIQGIDSLVEGFFSPNSVNDWLYIPFPALEEKTFIIIHVFGGI